MSGWVEQVAEAIGGVPLTGEQAEYLGALIDDRTEATPRWLMVDDHAVFIFRTREDARREAELLGGTVYDLGWIQNRDARELVNFAVARVETLVRMRRAVPETEAADADLAELVAGNE